MLPTTSKGRTTSNVRPNSAFPHYLRRIIKWQQMDIEYTFWQMLHLCMSPKVVYQHTKYHKQTKNQWARDDPAFVVICSLLLAVATVAYCAAYDHSAGHAVYVVLSVVLSHFLIMGAVVATCCWLLTNNYLREEVSNSHVVEQRVEWLYAFDVHCNSFFPVFIMLYVVHYFLSPLLVAHGFFPVLLSNVLFMVAASYYHYLNFLGYDGNKVLQWFVEHLAIRRLSVNTVVYLGQYMGSKYTTFLGKDHFFLYPIGIVIVLSPILTLIGYNPSRHVMNLYFSQWV